MFILPDDPLGWVVGVRLAGARLLTAAHVKVT